MRDRLPFALAFGLLAYLFPALPAGRADAPIAQRWLQSVAVPDFRPAGTWSAWERQRAEIRATLWTLLGEFPPRTRPDQVRVVERRKGGERRALYIVAKYGHVAGTGAIKPGDQGE